MCIAIYKPEGKVLSLATLKECYTSNPDGAGFMYAENKKLHIEKGFFSFQTFYDAFKKHESKQAVIHFRIKTHGKIDTANCHPFAVNNSVGFVHNGVISGYGDADFSDTVRFNEAILRPLVSKWGNLALFQDPIIELIEGRIGYSKLVFLDRHGNHKIMNEHKGQWDDGVWYSNDSYKPYVAPVSTWENKSSWYDTKYDWKKNVTTIKPKELPKPKTIEVGALVELLEDIADPATQKVYETGELLEVVAVNKDFTCDLMHEDYNDQTSFLYNVPYHSLSFVDEFEDDSIDPVGIPAYHNYASPSLLKRK
jgi:glutamine amidotransferase